MMEQSHREPFVGVSLTGELIGQNEEMPGRGEFGIQVNADDSFTKLGNNGEEVFEGNPIRD